MKRILLILLALSLILLCACSDSPAPTEAPETTVPSTAAPTETTTATEPLNTAEYDAPLTCISLPYTTEALKDRDVTLATYRFPTPSVILSDAEISNEITLDLLNRIDQSAATAKSVFDNAKSDFSGQASWYPYYYHLQYEPIRLDRNVLSLYITEAVFDGSPRSASAYWSLNYDLATGAALSLPQVLREDYSADLMVNLIVEGLEGYGEDALFPEYKDVISGMFFTNTTTDQWYFTEEGICFFFTPYEIGPYASGVIVSEIPYDKLLGTLREEYFPMEQLDCIGTPEISLLNDPLAASDKYSQLGDLHLAAEGETYLFTIDGSALNIRIKEKYASPAQPGEDTAATVYACAGMGPKDGLLITTDAETLTMLTASWNSAGTAGECKLEVK